jgi:hypothetical protein
MNEPTTPSVTRLAGKERGPAWLFAPVSLTHSQVSVPLPCFPRTTLQHGAPLPCSGSASSRVPRPHRYYEGTTTSWLEYGLAYGFTRPSQCRSVGSLRCGVGPRRRAWPRSSPVPLAAHSLVDAQELPGSCAIHSMPLPRSTIPASPAALTIVRRQRRPRRIENEGTMHWAYRDSITRLQHPLPTLQQGQLPALAQGSLPAGG